MLTQSAQGRACHIFRIYQSYKQTAIYYSPLKDHKSLSFPKQLLFMFDVADPVCFGFNTFSTWLVYPSCSSPSGDFVLLHLLFAPFAALIERGVAV